MKILYSWLKDFINLEGINIDDICYDLTKIGLEVEDYKELKIDIFINLIPSLIINFNIRNIACIHNMTII